MGKPVSNTEHILARCLRMAGLKIQRQVEFGWCSVDFIIENRIVLEVEGVYHELPEMKDKDRRKTEFLEQKGYKVLRLRAEDIRRNPKSVVNLVKAQLKQ